MEHDYEKMWKELRKEIEYYKHKLKLKASDAAYANNQNMYEVYSSKKNQLSRVIGIMDKLERGGLLMKDDLEELIKFELFE